MALACIRHELVRSGTVDENEQALTTDEGEGYFKVGKNAPSKLV